jgi:hypothetical protein
MGMNAKYCMLVGIRKITATLAGETLKGSVAKCSSKGTFIQSGTGKRSGM